MSAARSDGARLAALMDSFGRSMARVSRGRDQAQDERLCLTVGQHGAGAQVHLDLGARQLERRCGATLGVSPKQFQRLTRFREALRMAVTAQRTSTADIALQAGFYDQSHLARGARQLAGDSMRSLVATASPGTQWWALATSRA